MKAASAQGDRYLKPTEDTSSSAGTSDVEGHACPALDIPRADRMSYIADMIHELQGLANEAECTTLAGILGLAHAEAQQQSQKLSTEI